MAKEKNFTRGPRIRSWGQTGVDRAALDAAVLTGRTYGDAEWRHTWRNDARAAKEWRMVSAHESEMATQGIFIYLADVDAHYERAKAAGAEIVKPPEDLPYGRSYTARDPDGHPWFFTTPPAEG